jgi:Spy/CpxP family protein refolding chaperone
MIKWILPVILSFLMSLINSTAFAGPGMEMRPEGYPRGEGGSKMEGRVRMHGEGGTMFFGDPEAMKTTLGLTDEQMDKIGKINNEYRKKLLKIREDLEPKRIKLQGLLEEENINLKDVRSLLEEISKFEVEIRILRINQMLDISNIFTPDQKKQLRNSMRRLMGILYRQPSAYPNGNEGVSID